MINWDEEYLKFEGILPYFSDEAVYLFKKSKKFHKLICDWKGSIVECRFYEGCRIAYMDAFYYKIGYNFNKKGGVCFYEKIEDLGEDD